MAAVGRPAKPTAIKVLAGNPGKRALNTREPRPRRALPACPRWLSKAARAEWRRVAAELYDAGLLTTVDRAALAGYCVAFARWQEAEGVVTAKGMVVKTTNGNLIQNPFLAIANRAMDDMRRFAAEFGMTPASRTRVVAADTGAGELSLAELLFASVDAELAEEMSDAPDR